MNTIKPMAEPIQEYRMPKDLLKLSYSHHAKSRLIERTTGKIIIAPTILRLTKDNVSDVRSVKKGIVCDCVVKAAYKKNIDMALVISVKNDYFAVVKTVYFETKHKAIKENRGISQEELVKINEGLEQFKRGIKENPKEERKPGENVSAIQSTVGRTARIKRMLGLWWTNLWRK